VKKHGETPIAGLAITNAFQLLVFTQWMIRSGRDVAVTMDSTKQLLYYRRNIPTEVLLFGLMLDERFFWH